MAKYKLYVYCRRNGLTRDGGLHAEGEYKNDKEAVKQLTTKGFDLYRYYDEVSMTIKRVDEDKEVEI